MNHVIELILKNYSATLGLMLTVLIGVVIYSIYQRMIILELKRKKHEFHNHLNSILAINQTNSDNTTKTCIIRYVEEIAGKPVTSTMVNLSNSLVIQAFMSQQKKNANNLGINLEYNIDVHARRYEITECDFVQVISNLFNNAFEAVMGLPIEKRYISVNFKETSIALENSIYQDIRNAEIKKFFAEGFSTKGKERGFGFTNIIKITKRYGIEIRAKAKNNRFIITLEFPAQER